MIAFLGVVVKHCFCEGARLRGIVTSWRDDVPPQLLTIWRLDFPLRPGKVYMCRNVAHSIEEFVRLIVSHAGLCCCSQRRSAHYIEQHSSRISCQGAQPHTRGNGADCSTPCPTRFRGGSADVAKVFDVLGLMCRLVSLLPLLRRSPCSTSRYPSSGSVWATLFCPVV